MRSISTGAVVRKTCKSWLCASCNVWLREGAQKLIAHGASTRLPGFDAALFTFTEPATATLDMPALYARHQRTVQRLRSRGWVTNYCTAVEFQGRGALHPHMIAHVPNGLLPKLREYGATKRNREQYGWHFNELVPLAADLGWGRMVDAVAASSFNDLAGYAIKGLAAYTTKEAHRKFKAAGAKRVRPLRFSRGWDQDGRRLRDFQRGELAGEGPWEDVTEMGPC